MCGVWQVENLAGGVCIYHSEYLIIMNKSLKLMVCLNPLQGCSFKHILYNTWSPECMCVELQINVVPSVVQLMLFLIQTKACTTGNMSHERSYCNFHNKNNLTCCLFSWSAVHNDWVYLITSWLTQIHIFEIQVRIFRGS